MKQIYEAPEVQVIEITHFNDGHDGTLGWQCPDIMQQR